MTAFNPKSGFGGSRVPRGLLPPVSVPQGPPAARRPREVDTFRASIRAFVSDAEAHPGSEYAVSALLTRFGFQKRRLYDVVCVLGAVGCCERRSIDSIFWHGQSRIGATFHQMQLDARVNLPAPALDGIIGSSDSVSIAPLTVQLVLCFLALQLATLDIRHISRYLSRQSQRRKTTLCKLYQITHILEAAGIVQRSQTPGQLTLAPEFFAPLDIEFEEAPLVGISAYSIDSLLNHRYLMVDRVLRARRDDFFTVVAREAAGEASESE